VLGVEPQIISSYIESGQARLIFWPMLDHGQASVNSHAAAECIGQQSADSFWLAHDAFFANQDELWSADREYFAGVAASFGLDQAAFASCYDAGAAHELVRQQDARRQELGIFRRPTFTINGQMLIGAQPFSTFQDLIEAALAAG
jgi:protein-disulfide isomerase